MKKIFSIEDTTANRISFWHLAVFLAVLPFDRIYSELALISLFIHTLIHLNKKELSFDRLKLAIAPAVIYFVVCFGTLYTAFPDRAFFEWEILLSLILFPFIFAVSSFDTKKYVVPLLFILGLSCVITLVYLYINAFLSIRYYRLPVSSILSPAFINHNFTQPIDLHATYFSMYIAVSFPLFVNQLLKKNKRWFKIGCASCLLVMIAGLIQLASRSVLLAVFVTQVFIMPFFIEGKIRRSRFIITALSLLMVTIGFITTNATFKTRYVTGLKTDLADRAADINSLEPRRVRWDCAITLIKQAPVLGHGSGSEIPLLKDLYFKQKYYQSYINELNSHNQYLGILVETGLLGLLVFLWVLYSGFARAIKSRNLFFLSFLVIVVVVCFSENLLSVNKTIFFFAFFFSFFMQRKPAIQI